MDETPAWVPLLFFAAIGISAAAGIALVNWLMRRDYEKRQEATDG